MKNKLDSKSISVRFYINIIFAVFIAVTLTGCGKLFDMIKGGGTLVSIEITSADPDSTIASGTSNQFTATGIYSDNYKKDITNEVLWTSSDETVASVSNGLAHSLLTGTANVSANLDGITAGKVLVVTSEVLVSIAVTPFNTSIAKGTQRQFTATGTFTDSSTQDLTAQVTWLSGNTGFAAIAFTGLAGGIDIGSTTISASFNGISGSTGITVTAAELVSIAITSTPAFTISIAKGRTVQYTATGTYSDSTTQNITPQVTWSSSNENAATISTGLATSIDVGSTTITAVDPDSSISSAATSTITLTITAAELESISVTPVTASIAKGTALQYTATGTYSDYTTANITSQVTWYSSDPLTATISNAGTNGLATAVESGLTTISAIDPATGISSIATSAPALTVTNAVLVSIDVTPANSSSAKGRIIPFIATGIYSDSSQQNLTTQVTWSSSTGAAVISNAAGSNGNATLVNTGSPTITADYPSTIISGSTVITITAAVLDSITVTPAAYSTAKGIPVQYTATGVYSDSSNQNLTTIVTWSSNNTEIAVISNTDGSRGLASSADVGSTIIIAVDPATSVSGSTSLTVTAAELVSIAVTPVNYSTSNGAPVQFTATGTYTDGTHQNNTTQVTWSSSSTSIATISNVDGSRGIASSTTVGSTTIQAIDPATSISNSTVLYVTNAVLVSISITPSNSSTPKGTAVQLTATGTYSDTSTQNLTTQVTWTSSNTTAATISNVDGSSGLTSAWTVGSTTITAALEAINNTTDLAVSSAELVSIQVSPNNTSIPVSFNRQYTATGIYTDGSMQNITSQVTWTSDAASIVTINPSTGLATSSAANTGPVIITAARPIPTVVTKTTNLTVTTAALQLISITPYDQTIIKSTKIQLKATGIYSDNSTRDITEQAVWSSSAAGIAAVSDSPGTKGLLTASVSNTGSSSITAVFSGITGTTPITVKDAILLTIAVTPLNPIAYGTTQQFKAIGHYDDNTDLDLTVTVTWSSSDLSKATISNIQGSQGLASSVSVGSTLIKAAFSSIEGSTNLEVRNITLQSITIIPATSILNIGQTVNFYANGTYSDSTVQDLTTQVLWSSSSQSVADVNNADGYKGQTTAITGGNAEISATREGVTGTATITVNNSDTESPVISSVALLSGYRVRIIFSKDMDVTTATTAANYIIADSTTMHGICSDNTNFTTSTQTPDFTISSITPVTLSEYIIQLSGASDATTYTIIGSKTALKDVSNNFLTCNNFASFAGQDNIKPYMVSVISSAPNEIILVYSEDMQSDGLSGAANYPGEYTLTIDSGTGNLPAIGSITRLNPRTYQISLTSNVDSISYKIQNINVKDLAGNIISTLNYLTFSGNEQLKVISAEALTLTTVKLTFSKDIVPASSNCSDIGSCEKLYKIIPDLGGITSAVTGTGNAANTVAITHQTPQTGVVYSIIAANRLDGDDFLNLTDNKSIIALIDNFDLQAQPKDRAPFVGLGTAIVTIDGGSYFSDPFSDATSFSYAFQYSSKIYLGPNTSNNNAFRFDANGYNAVLVNFIYNGSPVSFSSASPGPNGETDIVGFNSVNLTIGASPYELLVLGPYNNNGLTAFYYTRSLETQLIWNAAPILPAAGANTKSLQTIYGTGKYIYTALTSSHATHKPILFLNNFDNDSNDTIDANPTSTDMGARTITLIGKAGGNNAAIIGIDSIINYKGYMYLANNGGIVYSSSFTSFISSVSSVPSTQSGTTLQVNTLYKVKPGEKGVPYIVEYNGLLYMARNVAVSGSQQTTRLNGELWVCSPGGDNKCDPADWTKIISGTETDIPGGGASPNNAISLLQVNKPVISGNPGTLYVGFDCDSGASVWRYTGTQPAVTSSTMVSASWTKAGEFNNAANFNPALKYIISNAALSDGTDYYIYLTASDGANAIKVFRQKD